MSLGKIARNAKKDDIYKGHLQGLASRIRSDDWDVYALQDQYHNLLNGSDEHHKLITYSLLKPSIFDGFGQVIVAGACFDQSMLHRLWTGEGVRFEAPPKTLTKDLRYTVHENGALMTIYYVTEEDWSKQLRDKTFEADGSSTKVLDHVVAGIGALMRGDPFIWMGNKDLPPDIFDAMNAEQLPNSPHGLNSYQHYHNVVVLSALNPTPAHFSFLTTRQVDGEEVRDAHYRTAVYQAVMRCSARDPKNDHSKKIVVMDRSTADWLADLFPGAKLEPLGGKALGKLKRNPGRRRQHESNAERVAAHRAKQEQDWLRQLAEVNDASFDAHPYPDLKEVTSDRDVSTNSCNENTLKEGHIVTPITNGTVFGAITHKTAIGHYAYDGEDQFIDELREFHERVLDAKDEAGLISPAHFDADASADTSRGLANVRHIRGIWLDNDGGDLSPDKFVSFFPYLRIVIWNTYSSNKTKPRWRAFIPTDCAMSIEVHKLIMNQIEAVLNSKGYWSKADLEKKTRIKSRLNHGFDKSKFNAASLFFLPCQAKDPKDSFFIDHNEEPRGPLDVGKWIDRCILDLRPLKAPEKPAANSDKTTPETLTRSGVSASLQATRAALLATKAEDHATWKQERIDKALTEWRSTPRGEGHTAFFKLACALQRAGLDPYEIGAKLREEAGSAWSPAERRGEIGGIIKALGKRGRF